MSDLLSAGFLSPVELAERSFPDHATVARGSEVDVVHGDDGR